MKFRTTPARARFSSLPACLALLGACASAPAWSLTLGVTEGVTYRATDKEIIAKFEPIAAALSAAIKQPVNVRVIGTYNSLRDALGKQEVDMAFVHPAHLAFEATKGGKYSTMAWTKGFTEYKVSFLCKEGEPIKNWTTLKDKKLVTPDPDSITAVITRAMLREQSLPQGAMQVLTTRYQDAVPFYVDNGFANYGATAAKSVIKEWNDKGGKVCAQSKAVPIKQWIVSSQLDAKTADALRAALTALEDTEAGKKALAASGYKGFEAPKNDIEKSMIAWLGI